MSAWNSDLLRQLVILVIEHFILAVGIIVSLQATLITMCAALLVRFCQHDHQWSHRIWFAAVALLLAIIPVHAFQGGWPFGIVHSAAVDTSHIRNEGYADIESSPALLAAEARSDFGSNSPADSSQVGLDAASDLEALKAELPGSGEASRSLAANESSADAMHLLDWSMPASWASLSFSYVLCGGYLLGCTVCLFRLGWSIRRLTSITRSGAALNETSRDVFEQAASRIELEFMPTVRVVQSVSMPLTCGISNPMVLLPSDFEAWPLAEQRAVALHELMHIKRRDVLVELLARVMRAVYWFHPASALLARQLTLTRELATDQCVVACGEEPQTYANSVVNILTRINQHANNANLPTLPVIAMSAMGNLEFRLKSILLGEVQRPAMLRGRALIGLLLATAVMSTLRIEFVTAQTDLPSTAQADLEQGEVSSTTTPKAEIADNDLISRMAHCEVLTVTGEEYDAEFDVSGQVLSATGQPVEGAIVLLRESSTARISSEFKKYIDIPQRHLVRVNDVFARTITDRDGRYRFIGAKSPAMPKHWSNSWRGDVVAGHPQLGVGWTRLGSKPDRQRVDAGLVVALRPTATITGEYLAPDRSPLSGAVVYHYRSELPVKGISFSDNSLDLQASQLTPRATTNVTGEFAIAGIPQGCLATVIGAEHGRWLSTSAVIATSPELPLGKQQHSGSFGIREVDVQQSPISLVAEIGVEVTGTVVDEQGIAIEGATVSAGSFVDSFISDQQGSFSLLRQRTSWEAAAKQKGGMVRFVIRAPDGSNFVSCYQEIPLEVVLSGKRIQLAMLRGVRVSGKVVTNDGIPIADVRVSQITTRDSLAAVDTTDELGMYELTLVPGQHSLAFGTDIPGYQLPTTRAARFNDGIVSKDRPHKTFDVSAGNPIELEALVVQRTSQVKVSVILPNGRPAVGATVVLRGVDQSLKLPDRMPILTRPLQDLSKAVNTDAMGTAELYAFGMSTTDAQVEATLDSGSASYRGEASLTAMRDGVLPIELIQNWRLQGRVLLRGQPIAGARVTVSESVNPTGPGLLGGGIRVTLRNRGEVVTDAEGRYQMSVTADKAYSVSLQSIPGVVLDDTRVSHVAQQVAEGVLEVRDLDYTTGTEEIAGVVLDETGRPLPRASVRIPASTTWIGAHTDSQTTTDANGRFHLRKVPTGRHELHVGAPSAIRPWPSPSLIEATAGDKQMRITIDSRPLPDIPRLHPQQIVDLPATNEQTSSIRGRLMLGDKPMVGRKLGIVQEDRRRATNVTKLETSTNDDGFFEFENLPPARDYAIYTLLDQISECALPVSLIQAPANGKIAELGEIAAEPSHSLEISIRTADKSPLPAGGRISVSQGKAGHAARLDIPNDGESRAEVTLPAVGKEMLEISVRVPGYKVLRTLPNINRDWNRRYPLRFDGTMTFFVVLTPDK